MRGDAGAARVAAALDSVNVAQAGFSSGKFGGVSSGSPSVVNFSNVCKTPPLCVGYFNVGKPTGSFPSKVSVEEFSFPESCVFLIERICILGFDDTLLNGSITGRTVPAPVACDLRVWASNLLTVDGRFDAVSCSPATALGSLSFTPHAYLPTDRIIIQGCYECLTVCLFGWPLDVSADIRLSAGKRFQRSQMSHRIGRPPFLPSVPDTCPLDADMFAETMKSNQLPETASKASTRITTTEARSDKRKTTEEALSRYVLEINSSAFHRDFSTAVPDHSETKKDATQELWLDVPSLQFIREMATQAVAHIKELNTFMSTIASTDEEELFWCSRCIFLKCSVWRKLFSLVLWPLERNGTYSRFCGIAQQPQLLETSVDFFDALESSNSSFTPFDPFSGTMDQKSLCLRLLNALLRDSVFAVDFLLFFHGQWALPGLLGTQLLSSPPSYAWTYPEVDFHVCSTVRELFVPPPVSHVKAAALETISALALHRQGLEALASVAELEGVNDQSCESSAPASKCSGVLSIYELLVKEAVSNASYKRPYRARILTDIFSQMRLYRALTGFLHVAADVYGMDIDGSCFPRWYLEALTETMALLTALVQWKPDRSKEFENVGMGDGEPYDKAVGAYCEERNDGFGPTNKPWAIRLEDHDEAVKRFLRLVSGTPFLVYLVHIQNRLRRLQQSRCVVYANDCSIQGEEEAPQPSSNAQLAVAQTTETRKRLELVMQGAFSSVNAESLTFVGLVSAANALSAQLLKWVFFAPSGISTVLLQSGCLHNPPSLDGTLKSAVEDESDLVTNYGDSLHFPLAQQLPDDLRRFLEWHRTAFFLIVRLAEPLIVADSFLPSTLASQHLMLYLFPSLISRWEEQLLTETDVGHDISDSLSLRRLRELSDFLVDSQHVNAVLRLWGTSFVLPILLGRSLRRLVSRQCVLELNHANILLESNGQNVTECTTVAETVSNVATLTAIRHVVDILWRLWMHRGSDSFLRFLAAACYAPLMALCRAACDTAHKTAQTGTASRCCSSASESDPRNMIKELVKRAEDLAANGGAARTGPWGQVDAGFDAYVNLDATADETSEDSKGGMKMLKCLVPASLYTSLEQILEKDGVFLAQTIDLLSAMHLVVRGECQPMLRSLAELAEPENVRVSECSDILTALEDPSVHMLSLNKEGGPLGRLNSSSWSQTNEKQRLDLFITAFKLLVTTSTSNRVVPFTEPTQLGATSGTSGAKSGGASTGLQTPASVIALRLGGYSGTLGVPFLELQQSKTTEGALAASASLGGPAPDTATLSRRAGHGPAAAPGWVAETYTCVRFLLHEIMSYTPEVALNELTKASLNGEDVVAVLKSCCVENPHLTFLEDFVSLRTGLVSLLNRCSASLSPPLCLGNDGGFVYRLEGLDAFHWFQLASEIAPLTEVGLEFLYWLLDASLPSAPCPVTPALILNKKIAGPVSRFSSVTNAIWGPGSFLDSTLRDALLLIMLRLSQAWVLVVRGVASVDNAENLFSNFHWTENTLDASNENRSHLLHNRLRHCLDVAVAIIRLVCVRCPESAASILEAALRHSRLLPSSYVLGPLIVSAVGGFGAVFPSGGVFILFSNQPPPLMATELNGAEGRNLEAVVTRLKQMYLQRRLTDSEPALGFGNSASSGAVSRLPASMTTLCLSARTYLPLSIKRCLFGEDAPHFLVFQIPLAPPLAASPPAVLTGDSCLVAKTRPVGGYVWSQRRLGRLSMGHDSDLLSFSIFYPESLSSLLRPPDAALTTAAGDTDAVPEWAGWDRLWELLHDSLEEEAIEQVLETAYVPAVPLGLSPAHMVALTESRTSAKEMLRLLNDGELAAGKAQLARLQKTSHRFKHVKVEDIAEFVDLLLMSCYTSNNLLHASTAFTLATLTWTNGPPVFDLVLRVAHSVTENLCSFLAQELASRRSVAVSQMFLLTRLLLLADHTFSFFPQPTLEASEALLCLAAAGLQALQDIPVIDPSCPTFPVLMGLFDCILPAAVRLFRRGVKTLDSFVHLLKAPGEIQARAGLHVPVQAVSSSAQTAMTRIPQHFTNSVLIHQFKPLLQKSDGAASAGHGLRGAAALRPNAGGSAGAPGSEQWMTGILASLRSSCVGLSAILNQLPIAWDIKQRHNRGLNPLHSLDVNQEWSGLSISVVLSILATFHDVVATRFFTVVSLFEFPDTLLETFLSAVRKLGAFEELAVASGEKKSGEQPPQSPVAAAFLDISIAATQQPTIRLDGFIKSITETLINFNAVYSSSEDSSITSNNGAINSAWTSRWNALLDMVGYVISLGSSIMMDSGFHSASLLLSFAYAEDVLRASLEEETRRTKSSLNVSLDDARALYGDITNGTLNENSGKLDGDSGATEKPLLTLNNLQEGFLEELYEALLEVQSRLTEENESENNLFSKKTIFETLQLPIREHCRRLHALKESVMTTLKNDEPPLIIRGMQLIRTTKSGALNHPLHTNIDCYTPFVSSLPGVFPTTLFSENTNAFSNSAAQMITILAHSLASDALWRNAAVLDTVQADLTKSVEKATECSENDVNTFMCLSQVVRAQAADEALPTAGSLVAHFQKPQASSGVAFPSASSVHLSGGRSETSHWRPPPSSNVSMCSASNVPSTASADALASDPFRARRGVSSRAPSKHVDEFEAQLAKSETHEVSAPAVSKARPSNYGAAADYTSSAGNVEQSLDSIPQWREFVNSGKEHGLDVMCILTTPQLLQDPAIESRFRSLVELHPSIKTLFKMMELEM